MTEQTVTLITVLVPIIGMMLKQSRDQNRVYLAMTNILKEHTALLEHIVNKCDDNEKFHLGRHNLCRLADDSFKRGVVDDIVQGVR